MSSTDAAFSGSIPELYDGYLGPFLFEPYADELVSRLRGVRGRVLETAAGTGIVTLRLARDLPDGVEIVATDLNPPMLDIARARINRPDVTFLQADAQDLPFEDGEFDVVVCQYGMMFLPDRAAGYREALRVLRPGGLFLFNAWAPLEDNAVALAVTNALGALLPDDPPLFMRRVPHGYGDPARLQGDAEAAGFERVTVEPVSLTSRAPSAREPGIGFCKGTPVRAEIEARAPGRLDEITDKVIEALALRFGSLAIEAPMKAFVVTAYAPELG